MYQVKNKGFMNYAAAVNHALLKRAPITDECGNVIPTLRVTDKVTYNGESYSVYNVTRYGVILSNGRDVIDIQGNQIYNVHKSGEQQPRRQASQPQAQQFIIIF